MRFQKAIKRIVALGAGTLMLSSAFAAADLANYPAPFVKDGKFSGVLVVGDKAAAEDVIGITDIISSLQAASVKKVATSGGSSSVSVENGWKVGTSTKILEMTENLQTGTNREAIATITSNSFVDDSELPGLLAKGSVSNTKGTAEYDQRLYFEDPTTGFVQYRENDDDVTGDFLFFANGKQIARYEMEFTTQLESDVDDSTGTASTSGTFLTDLEDVELSMLGKTFQIVTARRVSSAGRSAILTLMGGAVRDTLLEGNTKTYTVDGKDFEVSLNYVDTDEAQFVVNGQTTRKLKDGDTDKLSDGTTVGVSEILYQDYAGGIHSATFFLGAQKVELRDTLVTDTASSNDLKVDDETIDDAHIWIEATDDNVTFKLDKIVVNISSADDFYVPAGGKLSEDMKSEGEEPEALFTKNWDIEYHGLSKVTTSQINIDAAGNDDYLLEFNDGRNNKVRLPLANAAAASQLRFGDDDNDLLVQENKSISKDDYFVLTDESDTDGERQSFALRYRGADKITADNPQVKFDDLGSGERLERPISAATSQTAGVYAGGVVGITEIAQIKLGGGTYRVYNLSSTAVDDFNILVDMDAGGVIDREIIALNTYDGARIEIYNGTPRNLSEGSGDAMNQVLINVTTPNADDYDDLRPTPLGFNISADSNGEVRIAKPVTLNNHSFQSPEDDDDNSYAYTSFGAFVKFSTPTSDPNEVVIEYPSEQRVPLVFITGTGATVSETEVASGDAVVVQKISVGAAKLASEVSSLTGQNSILVGGPCANRLSMEAMGNPADCAAGFEPGVGLVQLWEHSNGNVAMLVAGYSAVDTRNAAQVVANYKDYKGQLKGTKVEVKKVNNQLTVAQPAAKAMPAATTTTTSGTSGAAMDDNTTQ